MCEVGTLIFMPLPSNLLASCNSPNSLNPKGSEVVQEKQLIYCGESCPSPVCIGDVVLQLFSQVLSGSHIDLRPWVCTTDMQHCFHHLVFIVSFGVSPFPFRFPKLLKLCMRWTQVLLSMLMALVAVL